MKYKKKQEVLMDGELTLASLKRRVFAMLIDITLIIFIFIGILYIFHLMGYKINAKITGFTKVAVESEALSKTGTVFVQAIYISIVILYFTLMTYFLKGQTIGKKLLRIRAVSLYDERISFWHSLERTLGYVASSLELGLGFVQAAWNANRMTLHDKIASTIVIYIEKKKK